MSDHKYVINVKTGVVHGRTKSLDGHPDCRPYYPEDAKPAAKPVEAPAVEAPKRTRKAKSEGVSAAAAAIAAAESAISATAAIEEVDFTSAATSAGAEE